MKVGKISSLAAFLLLAVPVAAWAGGDPCAALGGDADGDGVCEDVDNCPGVSNASQMDNDGDGRGDVCDNCSMKKNGPNAFEAGIGSVSQCDRDQDGYGNACDDDLDQNGFQVGASDTPIYLTALMSFLPPTPANTDMDCNGFMVGASDTPIYLTTLMSFLPGPSGWGCAGTTTGVCPPLP